MTGDTADIKSAKLVKDGKTVSLAISGIGPVMQMMIKFNLKNADGAPMRLEIYNTINRVP